MTHVDGADPVSILIHEKLVGLTPNAPEYCIFRVHTLLRRVNEKAYDPQLLAIGPYHRDKDGLKLMEDHKLHYLQLLLRRRGETSVETYINAMRKLESRTRRCYAEPISLSTNEFVEMMLLDGCFIIELFRKFVMWDLIDQRDPIFQFSWMLYSLKRDLLLFENQIPFFVLTKLFEMTEVPNWQSNLIHLAVRFSQATLLPFECRIFESFHESFSDIEHLLALLYKFATPSIKSEDAEEKLISIPSATEIQEAGVKLKKLQSGSFFDIKFDNGVLEIPSLRIEDRSESVFRNLIAYEQYTQDNHFNYVTDYVTLMDYLINSPKDVELLRRRGIIENFLGDDEAVSTMFNKLVENVILSNFCYNKIFTDLNKHCSRRKNVWIANLRHKYFNSPWALISFLAAAFLLLLALAQTIFSIFSYIFPRN
ncbi:UPF0481 protein At3g47200-like [Alnus glutinosa]|uniref:UPF0481 protein At3g47200-like n=1 Tax=Alnus glutinosa TaxID=3517 RepID=UPI002D788234|nr:UPF0481 protein At3g47200-like [Alnus glutinosa]